MHIFLTNDDGAGTPGILALAEEAVRRGHRVTMVAPKVQQSAMSHRFTLDKPLFLGEYPVEIENCSSWTLDGSPADCVRVGVQCVAEGKVDAVISGINNGYNAGIAAQYSGTVGAAMEGAYHYIPSIAASCSHKASPETLKAMAEIAVTKAEELQSIPLPRAAILNINAPELPWQGQQYCPLGSSYFCDSYERRESPRAGTYFWLGGDGSVEAPQPGTDDDLLARGFVTLSVIGNFESFPEDVLRAH